MRDSKGRFVKGDRPSRATEFKPGQHWREPKIYWEHDWLYRQYVELERSAAEIASDFGCVEQNIFYFLRKHNIPRRTISGARKVKYWGASGEANGMFGKHGAECPNWKGGSTPERQAFYSSKEWITVAPRIWARDNGACQRCGEKYKWGIPSFHIHHIVSFIVVELRAEIDNLILLCGNCHRWVHSNMNIDNKFIKERR